MHHPPIIALATPWGRSAIAVLRISGLDCIKKFAPLFAPREKLLAAPANSLIVGNIVDRAHNERLDRVVVALYRAPHSYTGEDALEISCHGSPPGIRKILLLCQQSGFRMAEAGEFTHRALLAGKMDLTQAEAVREIIDARSAQAHSYAFHRLSGTVGDSIRREVERITELIAAINIQLDYPAEESGDIHFDTERLSATIDALIKIQESHQRGVHAHEGLTMVLTGAVNAGKSSLFNLLLGHERAIVDPAPGTTRDYIEGLIEVAGIPVRLFDTAGLRADSHHIERRGIGRALELARNAHIQVRLIDITTLDTTVHHTRRDSPHHSTSPRSAPHPVVIEVYNKVDAATPEQRSALGAEAITVSATQGTGVDTLLARLKSSVSLQWGAESREGHDNPLQVGSADIPIVSDRQHTLVGRAIVALQRALSAHQRGISPDVVVLDMHDALQLLGEITGEVTTEEVLTTMFSTFCVGK